MSLCYRVTGGSALRGTVVLSGSKNAALPLMAASLLCSGETTFTNVPHIRDTQVMLRILEFLGAEVSFEGNTVRLLTERVLNRPIPHDCVSQLRGSIVLLGPLLARFGEVEMAYPGGCVLGRRPVSAHFSALEQLGAVNRSTDDVLRFEGELRPGRVILPEFSVTATENALLASSLLCGETTIELAACEPHVQDLVHFLQRTGVVIHGGGTHRLHITGRKELHSCVHRVTSDYLECGALVLATLVTRGEVTIAEVEEDHLLCFLDAVRRTGGVCTYDASKRTLRVHGDTSPFRALEVRTNIFPGFPTDLQAPFSVLMTQAKGMSRVFERMFERRLGYLYELEKMGAHIEILNAREALIIGPTCLQGRTVASHDIRAGVTMVLAGLCAEGETVVTDVRYIERGYEQLPEKLCALGGCVEKILGVGKEGEVRSEVEEREGAVLA